MSNDTKRVLFAATAAALAVLAVAFVAIGQGPAPGAPGERGGGNDAAASALDASTDEIAVTGSSPAPFAPIADADDSTEVPLGVLLVRVVAMPERTPVAGAEVHLLTETADSLALGWASLADGGAVPPVLTDPEGRARLEWGAGDGPKRLVAHASGFTVTEVRLQVPARYPVRVELQRGLSIEGVIVDEAGHAVRGLDVEAVAVRRPHGRGSTLPMAGAERVRARADGEGRFQLTGLSAGSYRVTPESGDWLAKADLAASTADAAPGSEGVVAVAGARDVRLVVVRHATVALRLLDARTGEPIAAAWSTAGVRLPGRPGIAAAVTFAQHPPRLPANLEVEEDAGDPPASRVLASVPWDGVAREAEVDLRAAGYKPARVTVPLLLGPDESDAVEVVTPRPVTLEPEAAEGGCTLVVDCRREARGLLRPTTRMLTLCRPSDAARTHRAGRVLAEDRVEFRDLPAGEAIVEVFDGWTRSVPVRVTLDPARTVEARAEFGPLTGAVVELREESGARVFDADVLLVAPEGRDRALPDRAAATALVRGGVLVIPLEPGRYRYAVNKQGVGYDAGTFEVQAGAVVTVRARLGPIRRFDTRSRPK